MSLEADTIATLGAAPHLDHPRFGAAKSALLALARKIDGWDDVVAAAVEYARENGTRPTVPQNDNVSLSAYYKALDALGLTPGSWAKISGHAAAPTKPEGVTDDDSSTGSTDGGKAARVTALRSGVRSA